jgi:hypothetical protein
MEGLNHILLVVAIIVVLVDIIMKTVLINWVGEISSFKLSNFNHEDSSRNSDEREINLQ